MSTAVILVTGGGSERGNAHNTLLSVKDVFDSVDEDYDCEEVCIVVWAASDKFKDIVREESCDRGYEFKSLDCDVDSIVSYADEVYVIGDPDECDMPLVDKAFYEFVGNKEWLFIN